MLFCLLHNLAYKDRDFFLYRANNQQQRLRDAATISMTQRNDSGG